MAQPAAAAPAPAEQMDPGNPLQGSPMPAMPNEVLGVMQRLLREMDGYMNQPPDYVHPAVIQAYLERVFQWSNHLPMPPPPPEQSAPGGKGAPAPKRVS